ncbi:MAG: UDP-4-amino-4,6-dideoxy-N-acetyl-beta-L-altrosamine transaminase [Rikenellaceae bacterium]|nr:UDP-4-amino-4,6-dideoxy-N-acetyl-beta-L-altrosamine transaminase [Rikenellaceae bacterium]
MKPIPYGKHTITEEDIDSVVEVLRSDFLTQGPKIPEFENSFAEFCGARYAAAVSNGTAALHLCALALDVKPGDVVVTTPITFVASANGFRYCGAEIKFCDIDPVTKLMDLDKLEEILSEDQTGRIKGVVVVDFAGYPVNTEKLRSIADRYGLWIVEDACHAPGAYFIDSKGEKIKCGNGKYADLTVFSFHPVKHIAAGEGGMITTNNAGLYEKITRLRTHGITKNNELLSKNDGGWYYEMVDLGYNYRITDIQAALGLSQLGRIKANLDRRNAVAQIYNDGFKENENITIGNISKDIFHAYHLYIIEVKERKELYDYLHANGVLAQIHYIPAHLMPYYRRLGWSEGDFPNAERYYQQCLSLPMFPSLTEEELKYVIKKVLKFY